MKIFRILLISVALMISLQAASYGYADFGFYGGCLMPGQNEPGTSSESNGSQFGFIAHLAMNLPMLARFGIGGYYEHSLLSYDMTDENLSILQRTIAIDGYAQLMLPSLPLHPFARVSIAAWENRESGLENTTVYFQNYAMGGGLAYPISFEVVELNIYAEYLYGVSEFIFGKLSTSHMVHIGIRLYI